MCAKREFFKLGDLIVFASIVMLCVAILLFFSTKESTTVTVVQNGKQLYSFDLSDPALEGSQYLVSGKYENTICIRKGQVLVSNATCPDQLCVHSIPLDKKGGVICCVPNGVIITVGENNADMDVILR